MAERRSVADAMVPPRIEAFIKSGVTAAEPRQSERPEPRPDEAIVELEIERPTRTSGRGRPRRSSQASERGSQQVADHASAVLDDMLVPLTTKLRRQTVQALKRAYLEQKLGDATPSTQQEIVEEAVCEWLRRNGFLER